MPDSAFLGIRKIAGSMNSYIFYALTAAIVVYVLLRIGERTLIPKFFVPVTIESRELALKAEIEDCKRRLEGSERKNSEFENNQELLLNELRRANIKISKQEDQILELKTRIRELERNVPISSVPDSSGPTRRVLGIWPDSLPLDTEGEKTAIAGVGLEYEALEGLEASREGIVEKLGQQEYSILEIGAKGAANGIKLADGIAPPSWWGQLARQHKIDIFVILANESSKPGVLNVADAIFNAGAKSVISVDSVITDADAVKFARMFYRRLSRGIPIDKAVNYARLVITDSPSETIKLRER